MSLCTDMSAFAVAIGGKADMPLWSAYVRFSDIGACDPVAADGLSDTSD